MILTIGGVNHTDVLEEGSLVLRQYGTLRSRLQAKLNYPEIPVNFPKAGQEIILWDGDSILWGGIVVETEQVCHSTQSFSMTLRGQGYEQIMQRYELPWIKLEMNPSQAAEYIFDTYLNPDDGLIKGRIDAGILEENSYNFYPATASSVFDRLAQDNGFVWWVDKDKKFYMAPKIPKTNPSKIIDLTRKNTKRLDDIQTLVYRESTAGYKNEQCVYNPSEDIEGKHLHVSRMADMAMRYGSGEYGASARNDAVVNQSDAQAVAERILQKSPGLGEIEFTTDFANFVPGQMLGVIAPVCGIDQEKTFCITEIRAVYFYNRFRYRITATETDSDTLAIKAWESVLADGKNK